MDVLLDERVCCDDGGAGEGGGFRGVCHVCRCTKRWGIEVLVEELRIESGVYLGRISRA